MPTVVTIIRLCAQILKHKNGENKISDEKLAEYKKQFKEDICDDLNIPSALGVLFTMLKEPASKDIYNLAVDFDRVFGLGLKDLKEEKADIPEDIVKIADEMQNARKVKDWAVADKLRAELTEKGYIVKNTKDGYEISKK